MSEQQHTLEPCETDAASAVAALQAEIAAIKQAITDPENQPSQFGTVTYQMFELEKTKRIYWRKKFLARSSEWGVVKKQRDQLLADIDEESAVREKLATLLAETSIALKGPEAALFRHSWHDLAEVAGVVVAQRDELLAALESILPEFRQHSLRNLRDDETSENHRCRVFDHDDHLYEIANKVIASVKANT